MIPERQDRANDERPVCDCGHTLVYPLHVRADQTFADSGGCRYCADCHREPEEAS